MQAQDTVAIRAFLDYLRVEKGLSALTIEAYQRDLEQLASSLERRRGSIVRATTDGLRSFLAEFKANGVQPRSIGRKLSAFRHFYRFLLKEGEISADPTLNIENPKLWKVLPKALTEEQIGMLLQWTEEDQRLQLRNRAIVEVLYGAGLRVSELVNLEMQDLNIEAGQAIVRGKGDKDRIVPLGREAIRALKQYLNHARPLLLADRQLRWVFVDVRHTRMSRHRVWQIISKSAAERFHASPHMLRHSLGSHMVGNGADLRTVQTILGHADLSTTEAYTHLGQEILQKVYQQKHPRARMKAE